MSQYDGILTGALGDGGYSAVHRGSPHQIAQRITPNFEHKEGDRFGRYLPESFLPSIRLEPLYHDHFVISAGSPVCLTSNGMMVPAGYKILLGLGTGQGPQYTAADVIAGVRNAAGNAITAGDYVIDTMISEGIVIGNCMGVASYDVFMQLNSNPHNPAVYQYHNYNKQTGFAVLTHYVLEYPIEPNKRTAHTMTFTATGGETTVDLAHATVLEHHVIVKIGPDRFEDWGFDDGAGAAGVDQLNGFTLTVGQVVTVSYLYEESFYQSPFSGMATWRGSASTEGLVTYNKESKFVMYAAPTLTIGDTSGGDESANIKAAIAEAVASSQDIIGIVTGVSMEWPKQLLNLVTTAYDPRLYSPIINPETGLYTDGTGLDRMPGSATDGVPHAIQYAGGDLQTGMVNFKLKL